MRADLADGVAARPVPDRRKSRSGWGAVGTAPDRLICTGVRPVQRRAADVLLMHDEHALR